MKIWIDFINTPQVSFFVPFIKDFRKEGHEIILTCRDSGNTVDLLKQNDLEFSVIGDKVGKSLFRKLLFFPQRLIKLHSFIRTEKPDVAVSQSSFYQPVVAGFLGIPCLYTNDNEHAKGNLFGFLFATKVILPVALQNEKFTKRWPLNKKISFYPSVKEAIYLSQDPGLLPLAVGKKRIIYFRPEPWSAQYYKGPLNFFDDTLSRLSDEFEVIVLPRDKNQTDHYSQEKFASLKVAAKPVRLNQIVSECLLFIGAGGSMTRELAVLEIPVISIYQEELLSVDRYLMNKGLLKINPKITFEEIRSVIGSGSENKKEWSALNEGKGSYSLIKDIITNKLKNV